MSEKMSLDDYKEMNKASKSPVRKKQKRGEPEHNAQVALFDWAKLMVREIPELERLHAIPNGAKRPAGVGGYLKAEGVKAGVVDIFWDLPRGSYHGFRAELKVRDSRGRLNNPSEEQYAWIEYYKSVGYHADWYEGWTSIQDAILAYYSLGEFKAS